MPPALRRIRNHDLGRLVIFTRVSLSQRVAPCVIYFLGFLLPLVLCGCGSRRPVAARQPTPPQPPETPSATEEAAKRSTNVPETPASQPAAAPASKRNKPAPAPDRKSTRLNSSHRTISYAVFC